MKFCQRAFKGRLVLVFYQRSHVGQVAQDARNDTESAAPAKTRCSKQEISLWKRSFSFHRVTVLTFVFLVFFELMLCFACPSSVFQKADESAFLSLTLEDNVITYYTDVDEQGEPCGDTGRERFLFFCPVSLGLVSSEIFCESQFPCLVPNLSLVPGTIPLPHLRAVIVEGTDMRVITATQTMELTVSSASEAQVSARQTVSMATTFAPPPTPFYPPSIYLSVLYPF